MNAHPVTHPPRPAGRHGAPRRTRPGQWVLLVLGAVLTALGLGALVSGLVLAGAAAAQQDGRFLTTSPDRHQTITYALVGPPAVLDVGDAQISPVPFLDQLGRVQVRVTAADPEQEIFVGVAGTGDVDRYLDGVAHAELGRATESGDDTASRVPGERVPDRPGNQTFWADSDQGTGTRELTLDLRSGSWTLVVMNADATRPVWADLQLGARSELLGPLAGGQLVGGLVGLVLGVPLLLLGAAGLGRDIDPRTPPRGTGPGAALAGAPARDGTPRQVSPVRLTGFLDAGLSRWLWLVKWLLVIPHLIVLAVLWFALGVTTVAAGVAVLFTGRYPPSWFSFCVGVLRWSWRVGFYSYSALGTDRYPPFTLARADHPAELEVAYPERLSRGLVLVKWWLLAIPHLLILGVLAGGGSTWSTTRSGDDGTTTTSWGPSLLGLLVLVAAVILLFTGRYRPELFALVVGINRWVNRVLAYVLLMRDEYPPFRLDQGPVEPQPHGTAAPWAPPPQHRPEDRPDDRPGEGPEHGPGRQDPAR
ncbi:DUF4389 domain-containing protein [uncultured Kocuria sp.]|uniref:DUF4389 domain-containing protein n=1 Tax=uncultured Kocuria sp. TaxID=259305 RepID=UPI00261ACD81|nr:DUF4389 domain-containing protein [uncultured Kocuria sp.]